MAVARPRSRPHACGMPTRHDIFESKVPHHWTPMAGLGGTPGVQPPTPGVAQPGPGGSTYTTDQLKKLIASDIMTAGGRVATQADYDYWLPKLQSPCDSGFVTSGQMTGVGYYYHVGPPASMTLDH